MRLIKGGSSLDSRLQRFTAEHDKMAFAVAWASPGSEAYSAISNDRNKIQKAVIGTHFYQTHPDILDDFVDFKRCHFILQPQGVFHPKVFLFWSESTWDLLIGSANLTNGALTKNTELLLHVSSKDSDEKLRFQTERIISEYWNKGEVVTDVKAQTYRELWKTQQSTLRRVSGSYGNSNKSKTPIDTEIMAMSWVDFLRRVKSDPYHGFEKRCELLDLVRGAFSSHDSFSEMNLSMRKTIAGLPNDENEHWGWFGSMSGAGYYHQAINGNNPHIAQAIDSVPIVGAITSEHYLSYIEEFVRAFPNGRDGVGIASRLLALKRPDQFVCLDSKNKARLCKDFGIKQASMDYEHYWDDVVCRIMDSVWWNSPRPQQKIASQVWQGRAAMLDALFYHP